MKTVKIIKFESKEKEKERKIEMRTERKSGQIEMQRRMYVV